MCRTRSTSSRPAWAFSVRPVSVTTPSCTVTANGSAFHGDDLLFFRDSGARAGHRQRAKGERITQRRACGLLLGHRGGTHGGYPAAAIPVSTFVRDPR